MFNIKYGYRVYMGDFNFKEIDWERNSTNVGSNHLTTKFLEMVRDTFDFFIVPFEPT
jgi:hypothetical protein